MVGGLLEGAGGVIAVDAEHNVAAPFSADVLFRGHVSSDSLPVIAVGPNGDFVASASIAAKL